MIAMDEDALVCDIAETYHVLDYRALPARLTATLAAGLRENSRIKMKLAGTLCTSEELLLAMAVDRLSLLFWAKTADGQKNRNRPESVCEKMLGRHNKTHDRVCLAFDSPEAFEAAWIAGGGGAHHA